MKLADIIRLIHSAIKADSRELEEGDEVVSLFKNGTIIISCENHGVDVKVIMGEPYSFDEEIEL